jgi:large subunit ribosomal protein L25
VDREVLATLRAGMAGERLKLVVQERQSCGSRESRRLRRDGFVPGVLYGSGNARAFYVNERELRRVLTGDHGLHAILDVVLDGQEKAHHAVLKDYQLDARRSSLVHVDLHEVRLDRPIQTQVAIEAVGTPEGVTQGGILQVLVHQANVEALPMEIPDRLEIDVTDLNIGDSAQMTRLQVPERVTLLDDPETVIVAVLAPRALELPEDVVEEGEVEEEEGEGEAAEEGAAEQAPAEPETEES